MDIFFAEETYPQYNSDLCPYFKAMSTDPPNTRVTLTFVISINQELNSTITSYYGYLSDNGQFHS